MRGSEILWRDSAVEVSVATALNQDLSVDLLIIGGGFTGNAAALEASRRGASVCVLEAEILGYGGSGRNVGLVNAGLWLPPETVTAHMGEVAGRKLIDVLGDGPRRVFSIIAEEAIECEATPNGTLHLAHSAGGLKDLEERYRQGLAVGAPLQLLDAQETARRTGTSQYHGALLDPRAGTIQPFSYCRGLARAAAVKGAAIYDRSPVTGISRKDGFWHAEANGHSVRARSLLLATNAYQLGLGELYTPGFTTVSYFQLATVPMPEDVRRKILAGGEGCWDTATVMSSFRTDKAGRLILGGIGNTDGPGSATHKAWAKRKLQSLFPEVADLPFEHAWRGRIAMTDDHMPKIVQFAPDAYACFGYSGRGICPGTVFGTQAAIALLEQQPDALPVAPIDAYAERFSTAKACYYETGATLVHAVSVR